MRIRDSFYTDDSFRILHVNEDFEIMTVSFSDISDNQFAEQLKERLYNHCIRSIYSYHNVYYMYFVFKDGGNA